MPYPESSVGWVKRLGNLVLRIPCLPIEERGRNLGTRLVTLERDYTSWCLATILNKAKVQASTLLLTLLRCDLSSLALCRLVSPLELLLLFRFWGGIGGLEEFTGLNVMLCLVYALIPRDASAATLCRDPVPSRLADDSRTSWATEWSAFIVMRGWSSSGGCTIAIWSGARMFSLDLKKKGWLYTYNLLINNLLHLHLHLLIDNAFASSQYRFKK